ncbi:non-ribosomal peptide synthetase [Tahibacter amnicola]|uniref:Amino acid adenylation domain-containing protein n=1 Tax=Tahibacter amnicola TaxID=2976241 RepID=A0ABY6B8M1_9GAMM|nr:non-ribosomal peptide synthetase [Tahibacter amnicola]UXI66224.1 amino acid adenylation domain-containing protein [Tahibacter amnicola]
MKVVERIIERALQSQVALYLKDGKLAYTAAGGGLSDELRAEIAAHKTEIIAYLQALSGDADDTGGFRLERAPDGVDRPLSSQQHQVWLAQKINEQGQYNIANAFEFRAHLDPARLSSTLQHVLERHEILRTVYVADAAGEVRQRVLGSAAFAVTFTDLSAIDEAQQRNEVAALVAAEQARPFDLSRDFPIRAVCYSCSPSRSVLSITIHHIASDGWSQELLVGEIAAVYRALSEGRAPALAPLAFQYGDYAYSQQKALSEGRFEREKAYWLRELAGAATDPVLPTDFARPKVFVSSGASVECRLDAEESGRLGALAKRHNMTLFMLLESALALLLGRWTGREDVVIGSPIAGRDLEATHGLVGLFVNVLPLRTRCPVQGPLEQYLRDSKSRLLEAFAMQSLPLGIAMEALGVEQALSHTPLFQAVFNLQTVAAESLALGDIELAPLPQAPLIKYDLEVVALQGTDGLTLSWKYADRLFAANTIETLAEAYRALLRQIGSGDALDIADLVFSGLSAIASRGSEDVLADDNARASAIVQAHFPGSPVAWVRQGSAATGRHVVHVLLPDPLAAEVLAQRQRDAQAQLQSELGAHWQPDAWSLVGRECLAAAGHLDKKKLPTVAFALETDVQRQVAAVWQEILECQAIGLTDDFFDLGGNSIKAMRVTSKVSEVCSVDMQIRDIFEYTVLADYAAQVEARSLVRQPGIGKRPDGERMALSFSQERLWFLDQLNGGSPEYNMPALFQLEGRFDHLRAEEAMRTIVQRHEVLRTVYESDDAGAVQRVIDGADFRVAYADLSTLSEAAAQQELERLIRAEVVRPFDLAKDLMVRAGYFLLGHTEDGGQRGILLFNIHHIACDGWSLDLLVNEFVSVYRQLDTGDSAALPELPIQYGDYAYWQRQWLGSGSFDQQLGYWLKQLEDVPAVHALRLDRPRPEIKAYVGDSVAGGVDAATTAALDTLAKRFQLTPFMLMHAALALVLARNGNSDDVVVGTPVANRHQAQTEHLIGFFINTLVLRLNTGHGTLGDFLREVRQVHLDAQSNQDVPFELLVDRLNVPRTTQHTPLFQIMLTSDADYGLKRGEERALLMLPGARIRTYPFEGFAAKFDLEVNISQTFETTALRWTYDSAIFDRSSVERLNAHLERVMASLAALAADLGRAPETPLAPLPMLAEREIRFLLDRHDGRPVTYPQDRCIHQLFDAQAEKTPDAIALESDGVRLTYRELHEQASAIARHLRSVQAVGPGRLVGVCLERSVHLVAAVLGILKAGGAYVPLDPSYPKARTGHILEDAAIDLVLTQESLRGQFEGQRCELVVVDGDVVAAAAGTDDDSALPVVAPSDLAYVIYTSGSTGKPKGVAIRHANTVTMLYWARNTYSDAELARVLASTSLNFDLSVFELFVPLCFGHCCVLVRDALALIEQPVAVTLINTVPSAIKVLLDSDAIPAGTQVVNLAGEPLPKQTINDLLARRACRSVYNLYGPSEDTTYSTWMRFEAPVDGSVPIGRALPNSQALVLSPGLALLPPGVVGELYLCGAGVAKGYYNNPALTAERFIANPYYDAANPDSGPVLYRTGDLVRLDENGLLYFIGRVDSQVKLHGFRIELAEIELQLGRQTGVDAAIVVLRGSDEARQLVAYVKPAHMPPAGVEQAFVTALRESLAHALPAYMVPGAIVLMGEWPLTPNGKIDRAALPAPESATIAKTYLAPSSELERQLQDIWQQLLARERISVDADFFALGGNSLLLTRLHSRIKSSCGVNVPVKTLFAHRSIAAQAFIIEGFLAVSRAPDALAADVVEEEI